MISHQLLRVPFALAIATYVGLAARHVTLPGMYVDEPLLLLGVGYPTETGVAEPEDRWPLMISSYAGMLKSYVWEVPFRLFGLNVETLRLTAVAITAGGLIFAGGC